MNKVEQIYRFRDEMIERGDIQVILPEEEHRRHQKEGTFPITTQLSLDWSNSQNQRRSITGRAQ